MKLSGLLLLVAVAGPAYGGPRDERLVVELDGEAPFTATELDTALRVRLEAEGEGARVRVFAHDGIVTIGVGARTRTVTLAGETGPAAARVVALAALDLLLPDLASSPPAVPETIVATDAPSLHASVRRKAPDDLAVAAFGGGAMWSGALVGASIEASQPVFANRAVLALEVGGAHMFGGGLDLTAGIVRGSIGVRRGAIELRGGATLAPISVGNGAGDSTVLVGAGASARVRVPVGQTSSLVFAGGADVFATRSEYTRVDMPTYATPWFAPWFAVGMEVTP